MMHSLLRISAGGGDEEGGKEDGEITGWQADVVVSAAIGIAAALIYELVQIRKAIQDLVGVLKRENEEGVRGGAK